MVTAIVAAVAAAAAAARGRVDRASAAGPSSLSGLAVAVDPELPERAHVEPRRGRPPASSGPSTAHPPGHAGRARSRSPTCRPPPTPSRWAWWWPTTSERVLLRNAWPRALLGRSPRRRPGGRGGADQPALPPSGRAFDPDARAARSATAHGDGARGARRPIGGVAVALIEDVSERARLEAMRTDFVANISHELRTPVGALALLAETMVDEDDPALVRRLAEKMVAEATRVGRIIEDLLELSRIEHAGRPRLEVVQVGLLAAEAVDRVRVTGRPARHLGASWTEPSRRLTVVGDRRQLVSALANLIENGVKYSDPGSTVEVSARTDGARSSSSSWPTTASASRAATRTASSSASTASTGPAAARPAARASAWPSCATSPPTTAARCR